MKKSEIKFDIELDENDVPTKIIWSAEDGGVDKQICNALLLALWDEKEQNTLRIDLWTKNMLVDEMKKFYHQTLLTMADTFERATDEKEACDMLRKFSEDFGKKVGILK